MSLPRPARALLGTGLVVGLGASLLAGCSPSTITGDDEESFPVRLTSNVEQGATAVDVSTLVSVTAFHGNVTVTNLTTADGKEKVPGEGAEGSWKATQRLEPGTDYRLGVKAVGDDGKTKRLVRTFRTADLTLKEQTYPSVAPLKDETVGVGMPVIVTFDVPVKDRALYEKNMRVRVAGKDVAGSWSWLSDREVHYRPKTFWPAHSTIKVDLALNSLPAGNGIYGQQDQHLSFRTGAKMISVVNVKKHTLTLYKDATKVRTIPVSTGDSSHQTREGTKIIMEKFSSVDMDAATTGVDSTDPGYYNIKDVRWAMRLTNSGEFIHAAPWSVASQGNANVSHGCTGMSTADASWLYSRSHRGDVVKFVGSSRPLEDRNGWTDWNTSWKKWVAGSALTADPATS